MLFVFKVRGTERSSSISTMLYLLGQFWGFWTQAVLIGSQVDSANAAESHTLSVPQPLLMMDSESHYVLMKNLVQAVG